MWRCTKALLSLLFSVYFCLVILGESINYTSIHWAPFSSSSSTSLVWMVDTHCLCKSRVAAYAFLARRRRAPQITSNVSITPKVQSLSSRWCQVFAFSAIVLSFLSSHSFHTDQSRSALLFQSDLISHNRSSICTGTGYYTSTRTTAASVAACHDPSRFSAVCSLPQSIPFLNSVSL